MSPRFFFIAFVRQCAYAMVAFVAFGIIAERLIPSSVLPHLPLFWLAVIALILILFFPTVPSHHS